MKTMAIKLLIALGLILLGGILFFVFIRWYTVSSPWLDFIMPVVLALAALDISIIVLLFLPSDIQTFPVWKKITIGTGAAFIIIVLLFAAMLFAALTLGAITN